VVSVFHLTASPGQTCDIDDESFYSRAIWARAGGVAAEIGAIERFAKTRASDPPNR